MGCDAGIRPRKKVHVETATDNQPNKEIATMSSTMVRREMPQFTMDAYDAKTGHFTTVSSDDYKGK